MQITALLLKIADVLASLLALWGPSASGGLGEPTPFWNNERRPMPLFKRPNPHVLIAVCVMLGLTGCARTMVSAGTDPGLACRAFGPIHYSRHDTESSQRQSREHNAAWAAVCGK